TWPATSDVMCNTEVVYLPCVLPITSDVAGNTQGKYTTSVLMTGNTTAAPGTVTIVATMRATAINANIANSTVGLNSVDGGKVWTCLTTATGAPLASKYVPSNCRL